MKVRNNKQTKNQIWIYGKHAVRAAINNTDREVFRLVTSSPSLLEELRINDNKITPELVDKNFFFSIFPKDAIHQNCATLVKNLPENTIEDLILDENDNRPFVLLDQVIDPQNIGSILRASAVFGARAVVTTHHNSPDISCVIAKAASGALEKVPFIKVVNLVHTINYLKKKGFWCIGLDEKPTKTIYDENLKGKFMIIIGSEGTGMRRLTEETCDFLVKIPSFDSFSTLNAAQATIVALYEIAKQNRISS